MNPAKPLGKHEERLLFGAVSLAFLVASLYIGVWLVSNVRFVVVGAGTIVGCLLACYILGAGVLGLIARIKEAWT